MSWILVGSAALGVANAEWGGTKKKKAKPLPRTEGSLAGEKYLMELLGQSPNIPTQSVAELTPMQLAIQQALPDLLRRMGESGELATEEYRKTLTGDYDPRTSPYYEGLRQEADRLKTAGTTQLRQRAELGGMLQSTPAAAQEGEFINQANSGLLKELGRLLESERGRKMLAAEGIQGAESRNIGNLAAVGGIAETARSIEQQKADALYNQALMTILFPYQYQADIANSLMHYSPGYMITGGGPTDFSKFMSGFGSGMQIFSGMGGGMSGGGGAGSSFSNPQAVYGSPPGY